VYIDGRIVGDIGYYIDEDFGILFNEMGKKLLFSLFKQGNDKK